MTEYRQSHADAHAALNEAEEQLNIAQQKSQAALDIGMHMTSGAWQGGAATNYNQYWQQVHDEFQHHINRGRQHVETGRQNLNTHSNNDQSL